MAVNLNKRTALGAEGFLVARCNSDGTPISPTRVLGFYGTVDLTAYVASGDNAFLGIKIDNHAEDVQLVDWTPAVNKAAVTVDEMVTAINAAGFTDITAAPDPATGRLLIVYSGAGTIDFLQVFSVSTHPDFAAELDFGQGQEFGGEGAYYRECFDDAKSITLPNDIKDAENIESEAGDGTLITVMIAAIMKGKKPVLTFDDSDKQLKQMIQGGTWDSDTSTYTPPLSSQTRKPKFTIIVFSAIYNKGSSQREDMSGWQMLTLPMVTGIEADSTLEAKSLQEIAYNCNASEYENSSGVKQACYTETNLTEAEYVDLDPEGIEPDMEYTT